MLASYRVHEISSAESERWPVSLAHTGLPLPHCMSYMLPSSLRKNFLDLALFNHAALPPRIPKQALKDKGSRGFCGEEEGIAEAFGFDGIGGCSGERFGLVEIDGGQVDLFELDE